jgi:hypothetical protein
MLSLRHKFLFIHAPKTGGSSICQALAPYSEDRIVRVSPTNMDLFELNSPLLGIPSKHAIWEQYAEILTPEELGDLWTFSVARNPWDRIVSYWHSPHHDQRPSMKKVTAADFGNWLQKIASIERYVEDFGNIKTWLRFENLLADFGALTQPLRLPSTLRLPHRNASSHQHYSHYYTPAMRDMVEARFIREIEYFGYTFEKC